MHVQLHVRYDPMMDEARCDRMIGQIESAVLRMRDVSVEFTRAGHGVRTPFGRLTGFEVTPSYQAKYSLDAMEAMDRVNNAIASALLQEMTRDGGGVVNG